MNIYDMKNKIQQIAEIIPDYEDNFAQYDDLFEELLGPFYKLDHFLAKCKTLEVNSKFNMGYCQAILDIKKELGYTGDND